MRNKAQIYACDKPRAASRYSWELSPGAEPWAGSQQLLSALPIFAPGGLRCTLCLHSTRQTHLSHASGLPASWLVSFPPYTNGENEPEKGEVTFSKEHSTAAMELRTEPWAPGYQISC